MMAPALSEALNICRSQPELGARDELEKKALALIHPRGLQLSVDKLPCSPPVAASPPPAVPSPPTSASSSVTKYKNGLALNNNHLNRFLTLDSSIFDTPATADTAPRHHSPLSPPLSPVEDCDAGEEEEGRKNIRLLPHPPPPQTACDTMDILNLECHLPDSPSSQLSVVPTPNAVISCDNKPVEETMAFDIPQFPFPWDRTDAGDDATMRVDRIANRQATLARNYANVLDRVRRITVSCLCSHASRVAQRVTVSQHQPSVSTRRQKCPVSEEEPERTPKVEPSTAEECVKLMKKWEEDYGESSPGKRYINRLQSVAFVKEPKAQKRKPSSSAAFSLSLSTCSLKRSKFVELNADAKEELQTVFKQLHSQWRSLTSLDDGIDSCGEDDGEVTESSSGGESCDEYEGFDSNRRNVGDRPDRKLPSIEKRASSRWLAETQSLSARWDWLQVNAENLRTASESLEHCRRELRLRKGAVVEDLSKSISRLASKATYYPSSHLNANSNLSNADLRPQDGKPPSELPPSGGEASQNFRKNGYLLNNPSSSSTPLPPLPSSSSSTSTAGQRLHTDFRTTSESVVDESDVEESTQAETCSRLMPLAASFRKRRLLRIPPATTRRQTSPANVPKGLADLDEPVLAASRIHQAIHPVLSSMKDVPLSTHVDSLLLLQSRAERGPEEEDEDEEEPEEDYVDSRKKIPRKDDLVEEVRTNGKASSIASSSSSTSSRLRDRDRDRDWDPEREDKDNKPKFHRTKDGRFARVDSAASSPSRASSRSRGQKRSRADSHSSESKRHRRRRRDRHYESSSSSSRKSRHHSSTRSQPNSSREGSPALGGGGSSSRSRADRLSTSSASAAANRKAYLQKNYDINSVVIPTYSLYTDLPKRKEYKNIPTPAWKKVNRSVTAAVSTGWLDISRPTTSFRATHEPAVMRDELFAVLHFDSESKEKHSMKLPQDSSGGRNRQRKNTLNVPSGQGTPARATSPMSVDQGSDAGGIYSPSCSSPPPTPRSVDTNSSVGVVDGYSNPTSRTVNGQRRHNNPAPSSSSTSSSSAAARHAGRDEPSIFDDEESSMYYDRRHFPLSDAEFATLLDDVLGVQPPTTPQGVGAARQATGPIKWEDGPNLSESSDDDSDDEMSDDDESWEEQSKPKNKPQQRSDAPARTSVATSNR